MSDIDTNSWRGVHAELLRRINEKEWPPGSAVPNEADDPESEPRARKAGEINILAARGYNRGLRSVYFGIASSAWLIGPWALIVASVFTVGVVLRREFASQTRGVLLNEYPTRT